MPKKKIIQKIASEMTPNAPAKHWPASNASADSADAGWLTSLLTIGGVFLFVLVFGASLYLGYQKIYANKFYRGVTVAGLELGGQTYSEAQQIFQNKIDEMVRAGFLFSYKNQTVNISPHVTSPTDPDIAYDLVTFNPRQTLDTAWAVGRGQNYWQNFVSQIIAFTRDQPIPFAYQIDRYRLKQTISQNFSGQETPSQEAELKLTKSGDNYTAEITPEQSGQVFDYATALAQLETNLQNLTNNKIDLKLIAYQPKIKANDVTGLIDQIPEILNRAPLKLTFADQLWIIEKNQLADLLGFSLNESGRAVLSLDETKFHNFLDQTVAPEINQLAQDAKFNLQDGRAVEFQGAQEGRAIDKPQTLATIQKEFFVEKKNEIALIVATTQPKIATTDVNNLGIKEIIGVGKSNFAGSPANRRHNIKTGADKLNGILIKPGEEFSLLDALGEIEAATGYLQELVIKGNKTTPEFGGGLCQIGTTVFRAALASGLPITARQNHSYRVSYYEPAGTDATIYSPRPDMKFLNDTSNYVLIQTKIVGNELRFEFWGAKDGRQTWFSGQTESANLYEIKPKIYNLISPAPTKYVESLDIKIGAKKCTERAHVGATTDFDYQVTYTNGEVKKQTFHSVYRPWQEVCLIGVEKLSEPTIDETAPATNPDSPATDAPADTTSSTN